MEALSVTHMSVLVLSDFAKPALLKVFIAFELH